MSATPPHDPLEFVRNIWSNFGLPGHSMGAITPLLSITELDKKITDLKAVEGWLNLNMQLLRSSIQGLEVQRATMATLHAMGNAAGQMAQPENKEAEAATSADLNAGLNQAAAWWNVMQQQFLEAIKMTAQNTPENKKEPPTDKK